MVQLTYDTPRLRPDIKVERAMLFSAPARHSDSGTAGRGWLWHALGLASGWLGQDPGPATTRL